MMTLLYIFLSSLLIDKKLSAVLYFECKITMKFIGYVGNNQQIELEFLFIVSLNELFNS